MDTLDATGLTDLTELFRHDPAFAMPDPIDMAGLTDVPALRVLARRQHLHVDIDDGARQTAAAMLDQHAAAAGQHDTGSLTAAARQLAATDDIPTRRTVIADLDRRLAQFTPATASHNANAIHGLRWAISALHDALTPRQPITGISPGRVPAPAAVRETIVAGGGGQADQWASVWDACDSLRPRVIGWSPDGRAAAGEAATTVANSLDGVVVWSAGDPEGRHHRLAAAVRACREGAADVLVVPDGPFPLAPLARMASRGAGGWHVSAPHATAPAGRLVATVMARWCPDAARRRLARHLGSPTGPPPAVAARMLTLRAEGHSLRRIGAALTAEGHPAPRGGRWQHSTVARHLDALDCHGG